MHYIKIQKNDIFVIVKINHRSRLVVAMPQLKDKKLLQKIAMVLKALRFEAGLVQSDVYNDTNIHIGRIETAKANLSISTLAALCRFYKIPLTEFFKKLDALDKKK